MPGVIYVLVNPSFPEYVKIGYADNLAQRLEQFNRSECLPFAFRPYCVYEVDERLKDKDVHKLIDKLNPNLRAIDTFNGKPRIREFYNITPEDAYEILYTIASISNTTDRLKRFIPDECILKDKQIAEEIQSSGAVTYSEDGLLTHGNDSVKELYSDFKNGMLALGDVKAEPQKFYIAFKGSRNICSCIIRRQILKIIINATKGSLNDPRQLTRDISNVGHHGTGDYSIDIYDQQTLDYALSLIRQTYGSKLTTNAAPELPVLPTHPQCHTEPTPPTPPATDNAYTEEFHLSGHSTLIRNLYAEFKNKVTALSGIIVDSHKTYIAFKLSKNICALQIQKNKLQVTLNIPKGQLNDPQCLTRDVSNIGHRAPGNYTIDVHNAQTLEYALYLVKQAYIAQVPLQLP